MKNTVHSPAWQKSRGTPASHSLKAAGKKLSGGKNPFDFDRRPTNEEKAVKTHGGKSGSNPISFNKRPAGESKSRTAGD